MLGWDIECSRPQAAQDANEGFWRGTGGTHHLAAIRRSLWLVVWRLKRVGLVLLNEHEHRGSEEMKVELESNAAKSEVAGGARMTAARGREESGGAGGSLQSECKAGVGQLAVWRVRIGGRQLPKMWRGEERHSLPPACEHTLADLEAPGSNKQFVEER